MAVFKCKMCGGDLNVSERITVVECEYCGTNQTVSCSDDEKRINLYNRANRLRINSEFDKAANIYESIVAEFPEEAEAYWGLVICNYGIEYVDDPATAKKIPTCHRASFDSIQSDENYKLALEYADVSAQKVYRDEAREIDRIREEILSISKNEKPYDIFICYKETDVKGERTIDSVIAQDVYDTLTDKGYKVFFARISLEDKLGLQYEPYIFAALNSAKVMLSIGTTYEHFHAVWVKNEWSRFLKLMAKDRSKVLIPCYRDMDAYDLPDEFKALQAQNLGKVGAIQDLVRGISKVINTEKPIEPTKETIVTNNVQTDSLLRRAFMFLEDGDWKSANEYCEKVLDIDPECAKAYLGKLMAELKVKTQEDLKDCAQPFDNSNNYQKTLRFADENLKTTLIGYIEYIIKRNENARLDSIYSSAKNAMSTSTTEKAYIIAANIFKNIGDYLDSAELMQTCLEKAEICRKDDIYRNAKQAMLKKTTVEYTSAIELFEKIIDWRDSKVQIEICKEKIEEIKAQAEADRLERERILELERIEKQKRVKRNKKIAFSATAALCVIIAFVILLSTVIIPNSRYNNAIALMDAGKYTEAYEAFKKLDDYKDSTNKTTECYDLLLDSKYNDAIALMEEGNSDEAYEIFNELGDYKDAANKARDIRLTKIKKQFKNIKTGSYIKFGAYEQDNNTDNGKEEIEWLVLEVKDGKALVISKYALDAKKFGKISQTTSMRWRTSEIRLWLNVNFITSAFNADERSIIPTVTVSADGNPGDETQDQVFLLSITEAEKYFSSDSARECERTDYAIVNGAAYTGWWLRSSNIVDFSGSIHHDNLDLGNVSNIAVRPAMWINLS